MPIQDPVRQQSGGRRRAFEQGESECGDAHASMGAREAIAASLARIAVSRREHSTLEVGGPREHPTRDELYAEARRRDIPGRSKMSKEALERALGR